MKIKLRGNDSDWDYNRLVRVGQIAIDSMNDKRDTSGGWLTTDFNCTVSDPVYVNEILDRLMIEHPRLYAKVSKQAESGSSGPIKTWARACTIVPEFVGVTFMVHNASP